MTCKYVLNVICDKQTPGATRDDALVLKQALAKNAFVKDFMIRVCCHFLLILIDTVYHPLSMQHTLGDILW
jgi:hypothetical protein